MVLTMEIIAGLVWSLFGYKVFQQVSTSTAPLVLWLLVGAAGLAVVLSAPGWVASFSSS